ncbi:MAG TPA: DUF11 domain-containing protein [Isosphaeraceae bacterium]|nr:DUF11 domain-containing protein [Isosphaeraceae bacterium]
MTSPPVVHPLIPPNLQNLVKVSGLDISGIRLAYDPATDTLAVGLQQPDNQKTGQPVIAGDTDNNLNSGTVDPAVLAASPGFQDPADLGGTKTMGAFFDLNGTTTPTVVAGVASQFQPDVPSSVNNSKVYQVAAAVEPSGSPVAIPEFGTPLPQNTGGVYLVNDPAHGAFEFQVAHFSQLYLQETGHALTPDSTFSVGAFGNSGQDDGISEAFFPAQPVRFGDLVPTTDLTITKLETSGPGIVGQPLTYVLIATNSGPAASNNVTITDPLPAGLTYVSATSSQGTVTEANGTVTASLGTLAPGAGASVTIVAIPTVAGIVTNTGTVAGTPDNNPTNDTSTVTTTISPAHVCPPLEPPVLINPHSNSHVNIAHNDLVRVNVFGQARFDVTQIVPASVRFGGAAPIASFTRFINHDPYLDETFVFRGTDVNLPPGIQDAHITGSLTTGGSFDSVRRIFVRNDTSYTPAEIASRNARLAREGLNPPGATTAASAPATVSIPSSPVRQAVVDLLALKRPAGAPIKVVMPTTTAGTAAPAPVTIPRAVVPRSPRVKAVAAKAAAPPTSRPRRDWVRAHQAASVPVLGGAL